MTPASILGGTALAVILALTGCKDYAADDAEKLVALAIEAEHQRGIAADLAQCTEVYGVNASMVRRPDGTPDCTDKKGRRLKSQIVVLHRGEM